MKYDRIDFPLYRFTKRRWVDDFFSTGRLRLGTLFDYAINELYGDAVHDRHEGYCGFRLPYIDGQERGYAALVLARNNLVLCLADSFDDSMYEVFGADACLVVDSIEFFHCIDEVLREDYTELLLRKVRYIDKTSWGAMLTENEFAGVVKDNKFSYQKEVRALWEPKRPHTVNVDPRHQRPIEVSANNGVPDFCEEEWFSAYALAQCQWLEPLIISVPDARRFCSVRYR